MTGWHRGTASCMQAYSSSCKLLPLLSPLKYKSYKSNHRHASSFSSEPEAAVHNRSTIADLSHIGVVQESSCSCPRGKAGDHCWTGHLSFIFFISLVIFQTISETLMQVVNLMSSDVGQVVMLGQHINFLWSCPLQVCPITNLCGS